MLTPDPRSPIPDPQQHPFDALDLALLLLVAPLHPLLLALVIGQWFARRSSAVAASVVALLALVGLDSRHAEGRVARALLPGLAQPRRQEALPGARWRLLPGDDDLPALPPHPVAALPSITVAELAGSDNLLIVGNRGSGKTTLLQALVAHRRRRCYVLDPHSHPEKWPAHAKVIGGGRDFAAIYVALLRGEATLTTRAQQLSRDRGAVFAPFTLISDEWGSICAEIRPTREQEPPGRLLIRLLKEGRKFGISFIGCAHGDTAESLGSKGDTQAFRSSFDWIIYTGAFVSQQLKEHPELLRRLPLGRTPEGGSFPLRVVALSPVTGERRLLDLRGIDAPAAPATDGTPGVLLTPPVEAPAPRPALPTAPFPPSAPATDARPDVRTHPLPSGSTTLPPAPRTRDDLVRLLVQAGWSVTQIRDVIKGENATIGALVRQIEDEQLYVAAGQSPHI